MERTVEVSFVIDAEDYDDVEDNPLGVIMLVAEILRGRADLPPDVRIRCSDDVLALTEEEPVAEW